MKTMKRFYPFALLALAGGLLFSACSKDDDMPEPPTPPVIIDPVLGCMDSTSLNYNPQATVDDGSCEYATVFIPLKEGNYWRLTGQVLIPLLGTTVDVVQTVSVGKDSLIMGAVWHRVQERTNLAGLFNVQDETWWYNLGPTGKLWRIADGDTLKNCYITYPLDLGATWYSTDHQADFQYRMMSYNYEMDVPAGVFNNVMGIEVTDLNTNLTSTMYLSENFGLLKTTNEFDVLGTALTVAPELDSLYLVP
jgi:hypothetical protein